jgi:transcriptional regulator with XRE-family HTH domain
MADLYTLVGLDAALTERGMSHLELARRSGIRDAWYVRQIAGGKKVLARTALAIAKALDVRPETLTGGVPVTPPDEPVECGVERVLRMLKRIGGGVDYVQAS